MYILKLKETNRNERQAFFQQSQLNKLAKKIIGINVQGNENV